MPPGRERAGEADVTVEDGARGVADGVVGVVALHQDRVDPVMEPAVPNCPARSSRRGSWANTDSVYPRVVGGSPMLSPAALGHGEAGEAVHHEQHVLARFGEVLGDGGGHEGAADAVERRTIGGGHDEDVRPAPPR